MKSLSAMSVFFASFLYACGPAKTITPSISSVDFSNFTFPWSKELGVVGESFTLRNGERPPTRDERGFIDEMGVYMGGVWYGDLTDDGAEEAIVFLSVQTGGSAIPGIVYVYAWKDGKPSMMWSEVTGDRANGGLRAASAEQGHLILEVNDLEGSRGDCCLVKFARTKYKWDGATFRQVARDIFPIPEK